MVTQVSRGPVESKWIASPLGSGSETLGEVGVVDRDVGSGTHSEVFHQAQLHRVARAGIVNLRDDLQPPTFERRSASCNAL